MAEVSSPARQSGCRREGAAAALRRHSPEISEIAVAERAASASPSRSLRDDEAQASSPVRRPQSGIAIGQRTTS